MGDRLHALAAALLLVAAGAARAEDLRPLPKSAPQDQAAPAVRLHLLADDRLDPDALRALNREGVVLWLRTASNTLRESTLDTLAHFGDAWVQLRPPLRARDLEQLRRAPRAGVWIFAGPQDALPAVRPGPFRLALALRGPLDAPRLEEVARLGPAAVEWRPGGEVDLLAWSQFKNLPGRKWLVREPSELAPGACQGRDAPRDPALSVHLGAVLAAGTGAFPCGRGPRLRLGLDMEPWVAQAALVRDGSAELELDVGADLRAVGRARALLDALGLPARKAPWAR